MTKGTGQKRLPDKIPTNITATKRHRHGPVRPHIESCITKPAVARLAHRAGARRVAGDVVPGTRVLFKEHLRVVIRTANALREYRRRKTLRQSDIIEALKRVHTPIYVV